MIRRRGYIYYVSLPDVPERKPGLVVSADFVNEFLQAVVVRITTRAKLRSFPTSVTLRAGEGGLRQTSYVLCHEIATLEDSQIDPKPLGPPLDPERIVEVERALMTALGMA